MKAIVDDRCQGHARCIETAPEVFAADEQGHAVVQLDRVPPELGAVVRAAVQGCPERAISLSNETNTVDK